mgnify:CR=1 FL=1|nr:MAG TPA: YopX protein [Caudoviricetes sp.]
MIPKFRAWLKYEGCFADSIESIRYDKETIFLKWGGFGRGDRFEFYEVELMQSTGLFDKNGKEIFEGDIVDYKGRKAIIKWHGSYASFIYRFVDELQERKSEWKPLYLAYYKFEVVGNVHENKELLEVEE